MHHTFLNHLFVHLHCIKVLCLPPPPFSLPVACPHQRATAYAQLLSAPVSVRLSVSPVSHPPPLSLSLNLSFSPDVSSSLIILHVVQKPKTPPLFQHQPYITPKLPNYLPKSIQLHVYLRQHV